MDKTQLAIILTAQDKASAVLGGVTKKLQDMGVMSDGSAKQLEGLAERGAGAGAKLRAGVAIGAAAVAVAVADIGYKSVKSAADFQTSSSVLVTSAGESAKQIGMVRQRMLEVSSATGTAIEKLSGASGAMYQIESAGFHGADGLLLLRAAAQGAKAEGADVTKVADALSSSLKDYHMPASAAADVTSKLVAAVGAGKANFEDFTGSLHTVLPLASAMHEPLNDILGALASMTVHGMSANQATQYLSHSLLKMQSPTIGMTGELAQLGIKSSDLGDMLGKKGLTGTLQEISSAIVDKMGPAGKVMLSAFNGNKIMAEDAMSMMSAMSPKLKDMAEGYKNGSLSLKDFTKDTKALPTDQANLLKQFVALNNKASGFSDILKTGKNASQSYTQALQAATGDSVTMGTALLLTGENASTTAGAVKTVGKAHAEAGGNVAGWAYIQKNFNQQLAQAKNTFHNTGIALGSAFLPPLTKVLSVIIKMITPIAEWIGKHQKLASVILASVGAFAALVAVILTIGAAFHKIEDAARIIKGVAKASKIASAATKIWTGITKVATAVQWAMNAAWAASPIGVIIALVLLFIGIMVLLFVKCKPVHEFFMKLWKDLKKWFQEGVEFVKKHWQLLIAIMLGPLGIILGFVIKNFAAIKKAIMTPITEVWNFLKQLFAAIVKVFEYALLIILGIVILVFKGIWTAIHDPVMAIWNFLVKLWNDVYNFLADVLTRIFNFYVSIWKAIFNAISTVLSAIWNVIVSVWNTVYGFLSGILTAIVNFLIQRWNNAYANISAILGAIWGVISSVFNSVWSFIAGIWNQIYNTIAGAINSVLGVVKGLMNSIIGVFSGAGGWLVSAGGDIIKGLVNGIKGAAGAAAHAAEDVAKGAINAAKSFLGIHSPSTVFAEIGDFTAQGLAKGLTDNKGKVTTATKELAKTTVGSTNSSMQQQLALQKQMSELSRNKGTSINNNTTNHGGGTTINLNVKIGMYAGTASEKSAIAAEIWQSLNRIANTHNLSFPQIGVLPN